MDARDRWLARNPDLIVVGAHMGSMAYDVKEVAVRLDRYPNFFVDTSARFGDLGLQSTDVVRAFFIRYADRVLYGTDLSTRVPRDELNQEQIVAEARHIRRRLALHQAYLSKADLLSFRDYGTGYEANTYGLTLPDSVLRKVLHQNARDILQL